MKLWFVLYSYMYYKLFRNVVNVIYIYIYHTMFTNIKYYTNYLKNLKVSIKLYTSNNYYIKLNIILKRLKTQACPCEAQAQT